MKPAAVFSALFFAALVGTAQAAAPAQPPNLTGLVLETRNVGSYTYLRLRTASGEIWAAVPTATVVITNPTHYAVALAYERGTQAAPRVVAKGMDEVAARIRAIARDNRVPLVANPLLARALHQVEVEAEVPAEHFKAVAEIIAYVWRLRNQVAARR